MGEIYFYHVLHYYQMKLIVSNKILQFLHSSSVRIASLATEQEASFQPNTTTRAKITPGFVLWMKSTFWEIGNVIIQVSNNFPANITVNKARVYIDAASFTRELRNVFQVDRKWYDMLQHVMHWWIKYRKLMKFILVECEKSSRVSSFQNKPFVPKLQMNKTNTWIIHQ